MKRRLNGSYSWAARQSWLKEVGSIPKGYHLHHIDGNKENNDISNLQVLTPTEHHRTHFPNFELRDGVWWKKCIKCGETKPLEAFPSNGGKSTQRKCKLCYSPPPRIDWICLCCGHKWAGQIYTTDIVNPKLIRPLRCSNCGKKNWWLPKEERPKMGGPKRKPHRKLSQVMA